MSGTELERLDEAAAAIRARCGAPPDVAIVLGSGLGDFADSLADAVVAPYDTLPHWPQSRVVGHAGRLVVGGVAGKRVAALVGPRARLRRPPHGHRGVRRARDGAAGRAAG